MHDHLNQLPTRKQAAIFTTKVKVLQSLRMLEGLKGHVRKHVKSQELEDALVIASSSTPLWTEEHAAERDLTAGKIQNLRVACLALNGIVIPADEVFSFWKQTGRTTRKKGYVIGRELREGCLIPNLGGGLCQLSNGLYNAALKAGFEIIERHAHSQQVPGSLAAVGRDATVFWNYVDLRFKHHTAFSTEAYLSKNHLHIRFRSLEKGNEVQSLKDTNKAEVAPIGNCYSCNISGCFRNTPQDEAKVDLGRTAVLLDSYVPEFQVWLDENLKPDDQVYTPINAKRYRAPAYRWRNPTQKPFKHATALTLARSIRLRFLSSDGGSLQRTLIANDRKLAEFYASKIDYRVTHLIVSQNLLPHLWELGVMGGRTFEVLASRYPLEEIQKRLDKAHEKHTSSNTLNDFRVDQRLCMAEKEALQNARMIHTAHHGVADVMLGDVNRLSWVLPAGELEAKARAGKSAKSVLRIGFPASPLGKKGIYELKEAVEGMDAEVLILGKADEGVELSNSRSADLGEMMSCDVLVLPAYIEHSPRLLLRALAKGIPVIATKACGLPPQPGLMMMDVPDSSILSQLIFSETQYKVG